MAILKKSILSLMKDILVKINNFSDARHYCTVDEQKKFLYNFEVPKDNIERSYFQYLCQRKKMGALFSAFLSIFSFPVAIFLIVINVFRHKKDNEKQEDIYDAVFISNELPNSYIPISLIKEYKNMKSLTREQIASELDEDAYSLLKQIVRRYPLSWYFILKIVLKISWYSGALSNYKPKAIIASTEYSFTSSIITQYCQDKGIEHINISHGEHFFEIGRAFCYFSRFYIWDEFYIDLFKRLRADQTNYIVEKVDAHMFKAEYKVEKKYDYVYYLANETYEQLQKIASNLNELSNSGYEICIRPHPRYNKLQKSKWKELFLNFTIEDNSIVGIEESILRTRNVIAQFSAVLNQAYNNGVSIIIDDLANPERYEDLKNAEYIMFSKPHKLLSELIKEA